MASSTDFFANATQNRLALVPAAQGLASYGNMTISGDKDSVSAYKSRLKASQVNGAQATADNIKAPWSFTDFISGKSSLSRGTSPVSTSKRGR